MHYILIQHAIAYISIEYEIQFNSILISVANAKSNFGKSLFSKDK